ncbi:MAG: dihydrolipoamide acetyltransferase family protein [Steroidobacteraceae bacterium]|jgi:2-oxoisovalerate dehydrogenase E2 component (dihydrolipoyl transacylase)
MSRQVFKLPDLGEGTVAAEIIAWRAAVGDQIREDDPLVEMSTDKAVVEVPSPVSGRIVSIAGKPGDTVAVGSELVVFETEAAAAPATAAPAAAASPPAAALAAAPPSPAPPPAATRPVAGASGVRASPATRRRAQEAGVDLSTVRGSGPGGRIQSEDLQAALASAPATAAAHRAPASAVEEIPVIGIRRVIAQRMAEAKRTIPHFAYVEEVDITELEALRSHLNGRAAKAGLTYLPFIVMALVRVLRDFPQCNALYDTERNLILRHRSVHVGIATQTPDGLKVPVVRDAQDRSLSDLATEIRRVAEAARGRQASRELLGGSTITVTSLGRLGGIASTPVINAPEVAIVGINKAIDRPVVHRGAITIRRMMNLSSSFDHRFVDGFDAAAMIQALKERLEHPATIFIES